MRPLVLTGFMGTGKTTVGRLVARRCGLEFVDLDEEIERRCGRAIPEIFSEDGEAAFRRLEAEALEEALRREPAILATGGGALLSLENRALLPPHAEVVCLTASAPELRRRLNGSLDRPLLRNAGDLESLLAERAGAYASFPQIDTSGSSAAEIAGDIIARCNLASADTLEIERGMRTKLLVGEGLLSRAAEILTEAGIEGDVVVVSDETIAAAGHLGSITAALSEHAGRTINVVLKPGEEQKSLDTLKLLYDRCSEAELDRSACVLALGGGVVCDLAGMLASTYLRGLRFVSVPSTLLAQVDAAIGGKTGVDLDNAKNLVGAFYLPELVIVDPSLLHTLPRPALADGLAEIVKIAVVRSPDLIAMLQTLHDVSDVLDRVDIIRRAALEKMEVVRRDPFERGGRMILNFGHTIGHALEAASDFRLSHGQAVSLGMVIETRLAVSRGVCDEQVLESLLSLLSRFELPISSTLDVSTDQVMSYLRHDKKRHGHSFRFALPTGLGSGEIHSISERDTREAVSLALGSV
jgi:3-dehydroquinate synthase